MQPFPHTSLWCSAQLSTRTALPLFFNVTSHSTLSSPSVYFKWAAWKQSHYIPGMMTKGSNITHCIYDLLLLCRVLTPLCMKERRFRGNETFRKWIILCIMYLVRSSIQTGQDGTNLVRQKGFLSCSELSWAWFPTHSCKSSVTDLLVLHTEQNWDMFPIVLLYRVHASGRHRWL